MPSRRPASLRQPRLPGYPRPDGSARKRPGRDRLLCPSGEERPPGPLLLWKALHEAFPEIALKVGDITTRRVIGTGDRRLKLRPYQDRASADRAAEPPLMRRGFAERTAGAAAGRRGLVG
ncbi:DUF6545 domain-containing protein [Actinomadura keratinilytica]|uniref:DUF6545 domain-containing protein n=1 Tax=Actinomadura keratinilytica TaxID=547461 RepID=A0ABP7Z4X0_9ACTN